MQTFLIAIYDKNIRQHEHVGVSVRCEKKIIYLQNSETLKNPSICLFVCLFLSYQFFSNLSVIFSQSLSAMFAS
jgi:hypothetical protein